jgi:hypothetical protein
MKESAPTRITVPNNIPANMRSSVLSVPVVSGTRFLTERNPATANGKIKAGNRPIKSTIPVAMFQAGLLSASPSKPEPLLAAAEVNS